MDDIMYNRENNNERKNKMKLTIKTTRKANNPNNDQVWIQDVFTGKILWAGSRFRVKKMLKLLQK